MRYGKLVFCGMLVCSIFGSLPTFATTYSHDATVQFTFNSEISVVIDTADIEILDLAPGTSSDSNVVGITISTNNVVGYTASATVGNATYNTTNMTHTNGTNAFTSLAENASEYSLSTDNTWGYTTSLDNGSSWANFSGLPIYTDTPKEIAKTTSPADDAIKFKINAKASTSQAAGDYKNVINFTVVANVPPKTIDDVLDEDPNTPTDPETHRPIIQAITEDVCDEVEAIDESSLVTDIRDHKNYWVAKLRDGKCWMTQNLDFNIPSTALSSTTTDLTQYGVGGYTSTDGYSKSGNTIYWTPVRATLPTSSIDSNSYVTGWPDDVDHPYSVDPGNWYFTDTWYDDTDIYNYLAGNAGNRFSTDAYPGNGLHGHVGNYYNWPAAIATNNASSYTNSTYEDAAQNPQNSVCPANWQLPVMAKYSNYEVGANDYYNLGYLYNSAYNDEHISESPTWFTRTGWITPGGGLNSAGGYGLYWSSTVANEMSGYDIYFHHWGFNARNYYTKSNGGAVRCVNRQSPKYTITFDANSGAGSMPSQRGKTGKSVILSQNQFSRSGYIFNGWNTKIDGTGIGYGDKDELVLTGNITLYAQWAEDSGQGGGSGHYGKTIQDAYEQAYVNNPGQFPKDGGGYKHGLYVPHKTNGVYDGTYFEATQQSDYDGIPARDLRFAMQDIDLEIDGVKVCDYATVIGSEAYVLDLRDFKSYWIAKLADGKCWMTQNLDFDLENGTALTPDSSDVQSNWNPPYSTIHGTVAAADLSGRGWSMNNPYLPLSYDPGFSLYYTSQSGTNTQFTSLSDCMTTLGLNWQEECMHYHIGNLYSQAGVAAKNTIQDISGNVNFDSSVCPAGWVPPAGITGSTGSAETTPAYNTLLTSYGIVAPGYTTSGNSSMSKNYISGKANAVYDSPLYFVKSGQVSNMSYWRGPGTSEYWDGTFLDATVYFTTFGANGAQLAVGGIGWCGRAVRCIAR